MAVNIERTQFLLTSSRCPACHQRTLAAKLNCSVHDRECEVRVACSTCNAEYIVEGDAKARSSAIVCDAATHVCRVTPVTSARL